MVSFIFNSITHSDTTCNTILRVKLLLKFIILIFSTKYQYLYFKYGLNEAGWYSKIDQLMDKVNIKLDIIALIEDICLE